MFTKQQPIKIAGLGRYLPERIVPNQEVEQLCGLPEGWVWAKNGVKERRWADPVRETSSYMSAQAAREALEEANLKPTELDLIINASGTPEQAIPDTAALVQRQLGLEQSGIPCFSVDATCLSFIVAMQVAAGMFAIQNYKNILIVSADIASCGLNFAEHESATLMGDAAAAVVLTRATQDESSRFTAAHFKTFSAGAHLTEIRGGGSAHHPRYADTTEEDNLFHMAGPEVLRLARRHSRPFLEEIRQGLSKGLGNIDLVVPHQASGVGLKLMRFFGWPDDKVMTTLEWLGNCVSASIPATLYEAARQGKMKRGDEILLVGTGAGLSIGGLIFVY